MACFRPLRAWKDAEDRVVLRASRGSPDSRLELPCGKCIGCRMAWARMWAIRCCHESQLHAASCFVTLTFDQEHVPRTGSVSKRDWQLFAKRVRRKCGPFRFFACGEYGGLNRRPHYHALMFGMDFREDAIPLEKKDLYTSPTLVERWENGNVSIGAVTPKSAAYVASYSVKKQREQMDPERLCRFDSKTGEYWYVEPEFVLMSRRPGLGRGWIEKFKSDVYPSDEVVLSGRRVSPPRYYDERLPAEELAELKLRRRDRAEARAADCTPERLRVREQCAELSLRARG